MKLSKQVKKITQWYISLASIWIGYYIVRFVQTDNMMYKDTAGSLVMLLGMPFIIYYVVKIIARFML